MQEEVIAPSCERADDLIAFLYGEIKGPEARNFKLHLQECTTCKSDLASFKQIRNSIDSWRQESLGVLAAAKGDSAQRQLSLTAPRPSARAAIREFFNLSPLWMKGAVAFACLIFCIMAVLGIARLRETPRALLEANQRLYTKEELDAQVAKRVEERLAQYQLADQRNSNTATVTAPQKQPRKSGTRSTAGNSPEFAMGGSHSTRRPLTRMERTQLAADLRLISPNEETDLDLLGDRLNRQD